MPLLHRWPSKFQFAQKQQKILDMTGNTGKIPKDSARLDWSKKALGFDKTGPRVLASNSYPVLTGPIPPLCANSPFHWHLPVQQFRQTQRTAVETRFLSQMVCLLFLWMDGVYSPVILFGMVFAKGLQVIC